MSDNLPATLPEISAELAAIQREMPTPAYRQDEGKQERYRALERRRQELERGDVEGDGELPLDIYGVPSKAEFLKACPDGDYGALVAFQREANDIFNGMPEEHRVPFVESVTALPETLQLRMIGEFVNRATIASADASADELEAFRDSDEGDILAPVWGADTPRKFGRVLARTLRMAAGMPEGEWGRYLAWLRGQSPQAVAALYRKLAA